jgi:hypothetical protein
VKQNERRYISFMLRLWLTQDGTQSIWRVSLEDPVSGERRGFANIEQLCAFLKRQISADGGSGGLPAENRKKAGDNRDRESRS